VGIKIMALVRNQRDAHTACVTYRAGGTAASGRNDYANLDKLGHKLNRFGTFLPQTSFPTGYTPPYSLVIARTEGGLGSNFNLSATISMTDAQAAAGKNMAGDLTASVVLTNAQLDSVIDMLASISASGALTDAGLASVAALIASISSSGSITDATLGAIIDIIASGLSANGQFTDVDNFATSEISADISSTTALSPENLAAAVWRSLAADYIDAGTMGELLNTAGSGGLSPSQNAMLEFINLFAKSKI
jgi:hypothetical protein